MLRPGTDRSDYGLQLQPPAGFTLDAAIATTYSLNLDTLLALPVALCFSDTLEGNLRGEKIAILEALSQLQSRLAVFYQTGNIHVPPSFNRLFTLLEPFLSPITPRADGTNDAFTSFHPKLWLLRFRSKDKRNELRYRLLILSRNITFDRSWDVAACLDGVPEPGRWTDEDALSVFIRSLASHAVKASQSMIEELADEVPNVKWILPRPFSSMKMLPGGGAHCRTREERFRTPLDFGRTVDELIVVSPFLDAQAPRALDRLGAQTSGPRHLFSRSTSLNALGAEALAGWQCYSLNEAIVNGEERRELPDAEVQDLHAKLFISQSGKTTHWHLGSANATNAALGSTDQSPPRNSEFMLRLTTTSPDATPAALLKEWLDNPAGNLFIVHRFEALEDSEVDSYAAALRQLSHQLISAKWQLRAECDADTRYSLHLTIEPSIAIPEGFQIDVGVLCIPGRYDRLPPASVQQITWTGLALTQISAFIPLRITGPIADVPESLVIQAALQLPTDADRSSAILRELVDTPDKLMNYVRLLLHPDSSKEHWEGLGTGKKDGEDGDLFGFDLTSGLLEQLLHAASRRPQQLERVRQLIHRLTRMGMPIPEEFQALWKHFAAYAKETS